MTAFSQGKRDFVVPEALRKPVRITATIPWATHDKLARQSLSEGRSFSNLVAFILERHS
jgi:hypothetical protein